MSLPRQTMIELMALADGELEGEEKERVERLAAESEDARRIVESFRASDVARWLDEALDARGPAADGIADAVMARIEGPPPRTTRPSRMPVRARGPRPGGARRSRVAVVGATVGVALALAAAIAMYVRAVPHVVPSAGSVGPEARGVPAASETDDIRGAGDPGRSASVSPGATPAGRGVEVEEIDSPSHVSIFEIAAVANASTASSVVVWVDDEPGPK
jgi:hypothetical protein